PPGQHGQRRKKYSDYGLRLEEKQKIRYHYDLNESQLKRFVGMAKRTAKGPWIDKLIELLELRLDNVIFRAGFAPSIKAAAQLVSHRKVLVNGKVISIRSQVLKQKDSVRLKDEVYSNENFMYSKQSPRLQLADWLQKTAAGDIETILVNDTPQIGTVPFPFDPSLFVEFYSNLKK
ncbi:MAG: 30S ribosomal protein S4, partial [Bdellovibrionaceae bacterium]|nr:30S ribosomal protein S4 [Pseudobdellovibrionaceae bacterium]